MMRLNRLRQVSSAKAMDKFCHNHEDNKQKVASSGLHF